MSALFATLPAPRHTPLSHDDDNNDHTASTSKASTKANGGDVNEQQLVDPRAEIPPYGQRRSWRPTQQAHFGDGGAYPECHVAQYPLDLGKRTKTTAGNTLALQVGADGKVSFDAIAQQGHREGVSVQSQFKDLIPLAHRTDLPASLQAMERPSEDEVQATAERTKAALEKLVTGKIKAAQPKNVEKTGGNSQFIRYTPSEGDGKQRIIKMTDVVEDPLEPPKFKGKKIPRGPPSPPPPVLRSPPRKVTAQEQKDWMIPPCVSNWKNNKGYTIPLDKRLAADGRGLQDVLINDRFAQFSEALYVADRHAREEVRQRSLMQQRIAEKEKESKEEALRAMAQRAREERAGIAAPAVRVAASGGGAGLGGALAAYGRDSDSDGGAKSDDDESEPEEEPEDGDEEGAKEREMIRRERRKEREREMRMSNMGTEQRAKILARATGRDISEKIALGLAKPTLSKDAMLDSRLFNQESLSGSFGDSDSYNLYDKPLFSGSSAAAAIYKPRGANVDDDGNELVGEEEVLKGMRNNRYGMGVAGKGFEGADSSEVRDGPVAFEKDVPLDPFGVDAFLESARGTGEKKRGLDTGKDDPARKRARE